MIIAFERYLAVCHPFKHNNFTRKKIVLFFAVIYFMAAFINSTAALEVSYLFDPKEIRSKYDSTMTGVQTECDSTFRKFSLNVIEPWGVVVSLKFY